MGFAFDLPRSLIGDGPLRFFGVRGERRLGARVRQEVPVAA